MKSKEFINIAKDKVKDYTISSYKNANMDIPNFDVYVVWNNFILGNNKALLSTSLQDKMYYEVTYDNNRDKIYLDAYKKEQNISYSNNEENVCYKALNKNFAIDYFLEYIKNIKEESPDCSKDFLKFKLNEELERIKEEVLIITEI